TLPAGALLDRWDRKQVMVYCDMGRALSLASIPLALVLGRLSIIQICIVAVVSSTLGVFFDIAELACLPQVVAKEQVPEALGRTQATIGVMNLISPPLGGMFFALRSLLPFLVDAISYTASVFSLLLIRTPFQEQRETPVRNLHVEISEGLRWLWKQPLLRTMALLTGGNVFFGAGEPLIVIVIAQQQHVSDTVIGLIFGVGGLGAILGALLVGRVQRRFSFAQVIVSVLWLYAAFWLPLAVVPSPPVLGMLVALLFFIGPFYNVVHISRRLAMAPDALQSRVNSVARLIALGFSPLGVALTGLLLQYWGPQGTILLSASGQVLLALVATMNQHIRRAPPLEELPPS
ncbi:MAG TPA: MFS transporter, partial [Ktedonobacteraceae bacterium]|nr:MFS transporter [Ktedonobacteraceae bacterium]